MSYVAVQWPIFFWGGLLCSCRTNGLCWINSNMNGVFCISFHIRILQYAKFGLCADVMPQFCDLSVKVKVTISITFSYVFSSSYMSNGESQLWTDTHIHAHAHTQNKHVSYPVHPHTKSPGRTEWPRSAKTLQLFSLHAHTQARTHTHLSLSGTEMSLRL